MPRNWRSEMERERRALKAETVAAVRAIVGAERAREGEPLAKHTTYRIGGPADLFVVADSVAEVQQLVPLIHDAGTPLLVLGGGANMLVRDGGVRGVVLTLGRGLADIDVVAAADEDVATAGAGASLGYLIKEARQRGWLGVAPIAGTPGSVGGALKMNAGDRHVWIGHFVEQVTLVQRDGTLRTMGREALGYAYRHSKVPAGAVIVSGRLRFRRGDVAQVRDEIDRHIEYRKSTQPLNQASCGSVFRNPEGASAGELIERVGLKGVRLHQAQLSDKHANWIVNLGDARARDVLALIRLAKNKVYEETGIRLEEEVLVVGEADEEDDA